MIASRILISSVFGLVFGSAGFADLSLNDRMKEAVLDYARRLEAATVELAETRTRIGDERAPLMAALRAEEDRIIRLEAEVGALETASARAESDRIDSESVWETAVRNLDYVSRVGEESLEGLRTTLLPGENEHYAGRTGALMRTFSQPQRIGRANAALDTADLQLERLRRQIGGYREPGMAVSRDDNQVVSGTFAFVGPEVFFAAEGMEVLGTVRLREGSPVPTVFHLSGWSRTRAGPLFEGGSGTILADASGGKALPFQQSEESVLGHLRKGGVVGYVIIGLGLFALTASLFKIADLRRLSVDEPTVVARVLDALVNGTGQDSERAIVDLRATTREMFEAGLRHLEKPKALMEEYLSAFILRQRIDHERRLPLLAVIAAAAPLLGLLGTVVGMVKTFTLITIYGTGNAGKLSSGISEALITTELGLIVAIPTLIIHGFLTHRTQKNLSRLEQYAVEFVTSVEERKIMQKGTP